MEVRDVVHGAIIIEPHEQPILESRFFQRLRQIRQLGFSEHSFPSATHNRYIHSLGALETASLVFDFIFKNPVNPLGALHTRAPKAYRRFRATLRLAALLHDIGHGPLSHTTEFAMPLLSELKLPEKIIGKRDPKTQAGHEDYTLKILLDSSFTSLLASATRTFDGTPEHVAALISPDVLLNDPFFFESIDGRKINFAPILSQIISGELDADRMDYLRRDSFYTGVNYGQIDFDWLAANLTAMVDEKQNCYLALQHRALYTFEDFLISRYHMFLMVYFHYKSVIFEEMLAQYFDSPDADYRLPSNIENYVDCHDGHLYAHLGRSSNPWARRIVERRSYQRLIELHSGIPTSPEAQKNQNKLFETLVKRLRDENIHAIVSTSTSELSKYEGKSQDPTGTSKGFPIYVRYDNHFSDPEFIPLNQCTHLFERYRETRSIRRIYVSPEDYVRSRLLTT